MTLIVAKRLGDTLIALSDTKLSSSTGEVWSLTSQANKLVCIGAGWIVGYAGNTYFADQCLRSIRVDADLGFSEMRDVLLSSHLESRSHRNEDTDFLLISSSTLSMHKISDGRSMRQEGNTAWIGDQPAFSKFQAMFHLSDEQHLALPKSRFELPGGLNIHNKIVDAVREDIHRRTKRALEAVISDRVVSSVGGFPITLVVRRGRCHFWPSVERVAANPYPTIAASSGRDPVFGESDTGDFNYEIIVSADAGSNTLAVYFRLTEKALVFRRWDGGIPFAAIVDELPPETAEHDLAARFGENMWRSRFERDASGTYVMSSNVPESARNSVSGLTEKQIDAS